MIYDYFIGVGRFLEFDNQFNYILNIKKISSQDIDNLLEESTRCVYPMKIWGVPRGVSLNNVNEFKALSGDKAWELSEKKPWTLLLVPGLLNDRIEQIINNLDNITEPFINLYLGEEHGKDILEKIS